MKIIILFHNRTITEDIAEAPCSLMLSNSAVETFGTGKEKPLAHFALGIAPGVKL